MIARTLALAIAILVVGGCNQGNNQSSGPAPAHKSDTAMPASDTPAKPDSTKQAVYTCPMHPEVISDKPGKCPKCGMNLVLKQQTPKDSTGDSGSGQMGQMHSH